MRAPILAAAALLAMAGASPALAKGCIRGAIAGGMAGHYVGKGHAIAGAAAGCIAMHHHYARCLIPAFDGALSAQAWKDALWDRFYTGAPARQRQSVEQYNIVKKA